MFSPNPYDALRSLCRMQPSRGVTACVQTTHSISLGNDLFGSIENDEPMR